MIMKQEELGEVLACLGNERTLFYYFKDRYCLDLIDWHMVKMKRQSLPISQLNNSSVKKFIQKPVVKEIIKHCGNGFLTKEIIEAFWPHDFLTFTLTLDCWGEGDKGYDQTSRNQRNLVLQVNFDNKHTSEYQRLLRPDDHYGPFEYWCHPVRQDAKKTMSWIRMDFDFSTNEALIEEIQNDWLRQANGELIRVKKRLSRKSTLKPGDIVHGIHCDYKDFEYYVEKVLKPYRKLWAEASMLAAIQFIRDTLGISTIYYHSFSTGNKLKKIYGLPPKSMYTQLPKQFGFELTEEAPEFLAKDKHAKRYIKAIKNPQWYRMAL